ncbi:unnamed protein product [Mucor hiemalis]
MYLKIKRSPRRILAITGILCSIKKRRFHSDLHLQEDMNIRRVLSTPLPNPTDEIDRLFLGSDDVFGGPELRRSAQHWMNDEKIQNSDNMFYKAMRGDTEPDNLKIAYACPNCTDYFDAEREFEDHYKEKHLSEKHANECDQVILAHKKNCFSISTPVNNATLYRPKFKLEDIVRLQPLVRMAIESNQDISEEDEKLSNKT